MTAVPPSARKPPGPFGVLAVLAAAGALVPAASAAQDTVRSPERGWFGVRFTVPEQLTVTVRRTSPRLVVADVYRDSPADLGGIVPGDWFVSVDGSPLSTYENWLRSTSGLHAGESVRLTVVRGGDRREVTLVADPAPPFVAPNPLDGLDVALARVDSIFEVLVTWSPAAEPWSWHGLPDIVLHSGPRGDTGALTVTFGDSATATGSVVLQRRGSGGEMTVMLRGPERGEAVPPPSAGGGGVGATELAGRVRALDEARLTVLAPRLLESTVLFGGVEVRDLTAELGRYFGVEKGVLVTNVMVGPGLLAGFRPGDVIMSVDGKGFESVRGFRRLLAELSTPIELMVLRQRNFVKIVYPRPASGRDAAS